MSPDPRRNTDDIVELVSSIEQGLKAKLGSQGISPGAHRVLKALYGSPTPITMGVLQAKTGVSHANLTSVTQTLFRGKLVEFSKGNDGRVRLIQLTPLGHQACLGHKTRVQEIEDELASVFGETNWKSIKQKLASLSNNMPKP